MIDWAVTSRYNSMVWIGPYSLFNDDISKWIPIFFLSAFERLHIYFVTIPHIWVKLETNISTIIKYYVTELNFMGFVAHLWETPLYDEFLEILSWRRPSNQQFYKLLNHKVLVFTQSCRTEIGLVTRLSISVKLHSFLWSSLNWAWSIAAIFTICMNSYRLFWLYSLQC